MPGEKCSDTSTATHTAPTVTIQGSRIIIVHKLQQYIGQLIVHATRCVGTVVLSGEVWNGLTSLLSTQCSTCWDTVTLETAQKVKGP